MLPSHFYASTEFVFKPSHIVKPLQRAIKSNRDQQRCWISHCRLVYTQGPRMIFLIVFICNPWNRVWYFFNWFSFHFPYQRKSHSSWIIASAVAQGGGGGFGPEPLEPSPGYATAVYYKTWEELESVNVWVLSKRMRFTVINAKGGTYHVHVLHLITFLLVI